MFRQDVDNSKRINEKRIKVLEVWNKMEWKIRNLEVLRSVGEDLRILAITKKLDWTVSKGEKFNSEELR